MNTQTQFMKFGEFVVDAVRKEIHNGVGVLKLSDKEFDVLRVLIERSPQTLSHNKMIELVWNGTAVENSSVEKAIANIRKVLDDDARNPKYIKTIYGEGYRFIGDLRVDATSHSADREFLPVAHRMGFEDSPPSKSKTVVIGIGILALLLCLGVFYWKGETIWTRITEKVVFADDFSGKLVDSSKWKVRGKSVKVIDGIAKISVDEPNNWGWLTSRYFEFDPEKILTIRSRMKVTYSKNLKEEVYFVGEFGIVPKNSQFDTQATDDRNNLFYGVKYANYDSEFVHKDDPKTKDVDETATGMKAEGFFLVKDGGRPHNKEYYLRGTVGPRIEPVWDKWFEQKIVYDPKSEKMSYFVDGKKRGEFIVGKVPLPAGENKLRMEIMPWGWWLNHSVEIDYIEITQ